LDSRLAKAEAKAGARPKSGRGAGRGSAAAGRSRGGRGSRSVGAGAGRPPGSRGSPKKRAGSASASAARGADISTRVADADMPTAPPEEFAATLHLPAPPSEDAAASGGKAQAEIVDKPAKAPWKAWASTDRDKDVGLRPAKILVDPSHIGLRERPPHAPGSMKDNHGKVKTVSGKAMKLGAAAKLESTESEVFQTGMNQNPWVPAFQSSRPQPGAKAGPQRPASAQEGWKRWLKVAEATKRRGEAKAAALHWLGKRKVLLQVGSLSGSTDQDEAGALEGAEEAPSAEEDEPPAAPPEGASRATEQPDGYAQELSRSGRHEELAMWWLKKNRMQKDPAQAFLAEEDANAAVMVQAWLRKHKAKSGSSEFDFAKVISGMELPCNTTRSLTPPPVSGGRATTSTMVSEAPSVVSSPQASSPTKPSSTLKVEFQSLLQRVAPQTFR